MVGRRPLHVTPIAALLEGHWYDAAASIMDEALRAEGSNAALTEARDLAVTARRVLDLDAEDFTIIARNHSQPWAARLAAACFPAGPRDSVRGAFASLVPLYELMLEVLEVRALRHEPVQIVVTAHIMGEYLRQLAWESTLGHGGDPLQMETFVGGSRWGTDDDACPHSSALRATAKRSLHACNGDVAGYTAYLDRFHSRLGDALGVCAMNFATVAAREHPDVGESCPNPCGFVTRLPLDRRRSLDARVRLAIIYVDSPLVALRHHAPVGHFFGVPSTEEISDAWLATWDKLTQPWSDGSNPLLDPTLASRAPKHEALPGMSALVSAVAGMPMGPGRLLREIGADVAHALLDVKVLTLPTAGVAENV